MRPTVIFAGTVRPGGLSGTLGEVAGAVLKRGASSFVFAFFSHDRAPAARLASCQAAGGRDGEVIRDKIIFSGSVRARSPLRNTRGGRWS